MPLPNPPESYMANSLAGDEQQQPQQQQKPTWMYGLSPEEIAHESEYRRVAPIFRNKVNNFLTTIAGPAPSEEVMDFSRGLLQHMLKTNFGKATDEYVKYKQANPLRRALTNAMVQATVNLSGDSYIDDVLNKRIPYQEAHAHGDDPRVVYWRSVLSGLRNVLQDKSVRGPMMKHLMDFRTLEQPVPFVQSKINYKLPEPPAEQ